MAYVPVRRGFTGPSAKIGGSTDYHIDLKLLESLPIAERVKAVDSIAKQYQSIGREIEFSNAAVSGQRWNPSLDLSDKVQLLNQAAAAHAHSKHPGWQSLDFYVPFKGKTRFDKGAVEDASIFLPAIPGGTVRSNSGGGYGYYSEALDPSGRTVFKIGHGNVDRPEELGELKIGDAPASTGTTTATPSESSGRTEDILKAFLYGAQIREKEKKEPTIQEQIKGQLLGGLLSQAMNPMGFLSSYTTSDPFLSGQSAATSDYLNGLLG